MLELLRIKNLALIQDMELEFHSGLNVLTGESGAGKSFILRALDFILGEKMSSSMVRPDKEKAMVEAVFILDGEEYILKRELASSTGRSRFFLNDSVSSQDKIQALRDRLLIHTSQHGQQKLLKPAQHIRILDGFLEDPGVLRKRDHILTQMHSLLDRKKGINETLARLEEKKDLLEYQKARIDEVQPKPGEEEELMGRREEIRSRAELTGDIQKALDLLHAPEINVLSSVYELCRAVDRLGKKSRIFLQHAMEMENVSAALEDLDRTLQSTSVQDESLELEAVEARLWELAQLKRKLNRSLEEIMDLEQEVKDHLSFLDQGRLDLKQIARQEEELAGELATAAKELNSARRKCAEVLKAGLEEELRSLGFSRHVRVEFQFSPDMIYPGVIEEKPRLLWIPNPGQPPQPLDRIASGGELSRFLLALAGLRSERDLSTLLFDEVDAGIGGTILTSVGQRIFSLAANRQVLLITHWPQLAALAHRHFLVRKKVSHGRTYTLCTVLSAEESRVELTRMAGGEKTLENAAGLQE